MGEKDLREDRGQGQAVVGCPACGRPMQLRPSRDPSSPDWWGCTGYPACDVRQSAGKDGQPVGVPADKETRQARIRAHDALDPIWDGALEVYQDESKDSSLTVEQLLQIARGRTYSWLADQLQMDRKDCHVANFDLFHCELVVKVCEGVTYDHVRAWARQRSRQKKVDKVVKRYGSEQIDVEFERHRDKTIQSLKRDMRP